MSYLSYIYKTGDGARMASRWNIEFLGRIDSQIKIRGFRIEPGEIETNYSNIKIYRSSDNLPGDEAENKHLCAYIVGDQEIDNPPPLKKFLSL